MQTSDPATAWTIGVTLIAVFALAAKDSGADTSTGGASLRLISEMETVEPGSTVAIGLHITPEPGFHTYWRAPGAVGLATSLEWNLPEGYSAGEISWPAPDRIKMFDIDAYGYRREVTLLTEVSIPTDAPPGTVATLEAKVLWMACSETCHPGHGTLRLDLAIAERARVAPEEKPLIDAARSAVPPAIQLGHTNATGAGDDVISIHLGEAARPAAEETLYFFDYGNAIDSNSTQELSANRGVLNLKRFTFVDPPEGRLTGVLFRSGGWDAAGGSKYVEIDIPYGMASGNPVKE